MALRTLLRGASRVGYALFLACALPGLWVLAAEPEWPLHAAALRLHILAGQGLAVVAIPALLAHLWLTGSRPFLPLVLGAAPLALAWWAFERGDALSWMRDGYMHRGISAAEAAGASVVLLLAVAGCVQVLPRLEKPRKTQLSGLLLALAAGPALALGWSGGEVRGDARWGAILGHSAVGFGATLLIVPHYRLVRRKLSGSRGFAAGLLAAVAAVGLWSWQTDRTWFSGFTEDGAEARWIVDELRESEPPERPLGPEFVAASAGCGAAGCHEAITAEWSGSAHRFAADNALYAAAIGGLVEDQGPAAAIACAACHDPDRALSGTVEAAYADGAPEPGDGVSCIGCHAAYDAPEPVGDGLVRFRHPRNHPGPDDTAGRRQLLQDPRLHRQNFQANRHLMSDEGCGVCHRATHDLSAGSVLLQNPYRAPDDPGPSRADVVVSCGLCHMPTVTPQPGGRMPLYQHRWPGVNTDLAAYVTHPDRGELSAGAAAVERFMEGELSAQHLPDAVDDNPEFAAWAEAAAGRGLLDVAVRATWSDVLEIEVQTTHRRAAHAFPIGPFDLQEVWLEVIVQDPATGETLAHVGGREDQRVDPDAPRLGARLLDASGAPLREHRLDRLHSVVARRQIQPGETIEDRLALPLPAPAGSLLVAAAWRFRRVNPEFAAFAMGEGAIDRFAVHTLGAATTGVRAARPPPGEPVTPPSEPPESPGRR